MVTIPESHYGARLSTTLHDHRSWIQIVFHFIRSTSDESQSTKREEDFFSQEFQ